WCLICDASVQTAEINARSLSVKSIRILLKVASPIIALIDELSSKSL
ncbi:12506_t:CDS:1, partial [Dentiscutata heterogama]